MMMGDGRDEQALGRVDGEAGHAKPIDGMKTRRRRQRFGTAALRIAKPKERSQGCRPATATATGAVAGAAEGMPHQHNHDASQPSPKTAAAAQVTYLC